MLELKSCPHCNGNGRIVSVSGFKSDRYRAVCEQCGASTRECETEQEAVSAWNMRAGGWIPVGERLPKELPESHPAWSDEVRPSNDVLVKRKGIRCLVVAWYSFSYESWMDSNELFEFDDVECWQELPEPPKEEA